MKTGLIILAFFISPDAFGQIDSSSIYFQALKYYNAYLDTVKSKSTEIIIETNNGITENLPSQVGKRHVIILKWNNQKEIYLSHNRKIIQVKIFPAEIKKNLIEINFTPYIGEYKGSRKGYYLAFSDWVIIRFKFDCQTDRYQYFDTKTGGI